MTFDAIVQRAIAATMAHDEAVIRDLLGRWVSGMEPAIVWRDGEIIGLCVACAQVSDTPFVLERP